MVKSGYTIFLCDYTSASDVKRVRSIAITTPEIVGNMHEMMTTDRRLRVHEIVDALGVTHTLMMCNRKMGKLFAHN